MQRCAALLALLMVCTVAASRTDLYSMRGRVTNSAEIGSKLHTLETEAIEQLDSDPSSSSSNSTRTEDDDDFLLPLPSSNVLQQEEDGELYHKAFTKEGPFILLCPLPMSAPCGALVVMLAFIICVIVCLHEKKKPAQEHNGQARKTEPVAPATTRPPIVHNQYTRGHGRRAPSSSKSNLNATDRHLHSHAQQHPAQGGEGGPWKMQQDSSATERQNGSPFLPSADEADPQATQPYTTVDDGDAGSASNASKGDMQVESSVAAATTGNNSTAGHDHPAAFSPAFSSTAGGSTAAQPRADTLSLSVLLPVWIYGVCCSVLQCMAVCCSVLQCVAVCYSLLQPHNPAPIPCP